MKVASNAFAGAGALKIQDSSILIPARPLLLAIEYRYKVGAKWLEDGKAKGETASTVCEEMAQYSEDADLRKIIGDLNSLYGKGGEKLDIVKRLIEIYGYPLDWRKYNI